MKTRIPIHDHSTSHVGFRSPGFLVLGHYGHGISDELLGCKRTFEQAERTAHRACRRVRFEEIIIQ